MTYEHKPDPVYGPAPLQERRKNPRLQIELMRADRNIERRVPDVTAPKPPTDEDKFRALFVLAGLTIVSWVPTRSGIPDNDSTFFLVHTNLGQMKVGMHMGTIYIGWAGTIYRKVVTTDPVVKTLTSVQATSWQKAAQYLIVFAHYAEAKDVQS